LRFNLLTTRFAIENKIAVLKKVVSFFFFFCFISIYGQKPTELVSPPKLLLPKSESEKPKLLKPKENKSLFSEDFFNPNIDLPKLNNDRKNPNLMFGENEKFLDPGKRYENRLNSKSEKDKNPNQFQTDQYLGDFRNNGKFVQIALRDHESPDGDLIRIMLNDKEVVSRVLLQERFKSIAIDLVMGFNKIDFVALNQGASGPNTAEVRVFDDNGKLVGSNRWNLATGVKATYIIVKEK
tara:strand:+ start:690 stop:1403 length:714 start_codon:yes stop_codon:yes gene_type:complete